MLILDKYIIRQFKNSLLFILLAIWLMFLLVDLIDHLDTYMDKHAALFSVIKYYIFYSPFVLILTLPIAMLLATLFSIGQLSRRNEITAMKSVGISLNRILLPVFALGLLVSFLTMIAGEAVLPYTDEKKLEVERVEIERGSAYANLNLHNLFVQDQSGTIFNLENYQSQKKLGTDVLVEKFKNGRLFERIEAQKMSWTGSGWLLEKGRYRIFSDSMESAGSEKYKKFDQLFRLDFKISPEALTRREKSTEEMGYRELANYVKAKRQTNQQVPKEMTDLYFKIAYPFISLIIILFGAPLAANPRRSGLAISFGVGLAVSFIYYVLLQIFRSLGYSQKLPPLLAAWLVNIVFAIVGMVILIKARK